MKKVIILILVLSQFIFTKCKYEEGGSLLSTKKARVVGTWNYNKYEALSSKFELFEDDHDSYSESMTMEKDGTFTGTIEYKDGTVETKEELEGKWEFTDDANFIRLVFLVNVDKIEYPETQVLRIIQLKGKEVIVEDGNGTWKYYTIEK